MEILGQRLTGALPDSLRATATARSLASAAAGKAPMRQGTAQPVPGFKPARYAHWVALGQQQQQLAEIETGERALTLVYRQLRQLDALPAPGSEELQRHQQQLQRLDRALTGPEGPLGASLQPRLLSEAAGRQGFVLDKVDLLSARAGAEQLQLFFPASGRGLSLQLPAQAQGAEVVALLQQGLAGEQIRVEQDEAGRLQFSVPPAQRRLLEEPVLFSGQGIRIPAGNPVPIKLSPAPSRLGQLAEDLAQRSPRELQDSLQRSMADIGRAMGELKQRRRTLLADAPAVSAAEAPATALPAGDFGQLLSALRAQANVSRQAVVALLSPA